MNNANDLKRIAAIHDLSGLGKCSLTVALPIISASGVECACLPTALLSTHTGEFEGFSFLDLSDEMLRIARHWKSTGASFDGIYSGYLASPAQAEIVGEIVNLLANEKTLVFVDPVMADNGRYYSKHGDKTCHAFKKLCAGASLITPNVTEAALLAGLPYRDGVHSEDYISSLLEGLSKITSGIVAITGVRPDSKRVGAVALEVSTGRRHGAFHNAVDGVFYGTGDIFASVLSALLVREADFAVALDMAIAFVADCIGRTIARGSPRRFGVDFESALPQYVAAVAEMFVK